MINKAQRMHQEPLPEDLARSVLKMSVPVLGDDGNLWDRLEEARAVMAAAVELANKGLQDNPVASIVAEHFRKQVGKKGPAHLLVDPQGTVMLVVDQGPLMEAPVDPDVPERVPLPPIVDLRKDAEALGIDWVPFGKNKTKLMTALAEARDKPVAPPPVIAAPPPVPVVRPTPPPAPVPVVRPTPPKPAPVTPPSRVLADEDEDLANFFQSGPSKPLKPIPAAAPAPAPVAAPVVAPAPVAPARRPPPPPVGPPRTFNGRSLSALAAHADAEVNIDAILATAPAAPPPSDSDPSDD